MKKKLLLARHLLRAFFRQFICFPRLRWCDICDAKKLFLSLEQDPFIGLRCTGCAGTTIHRGIFNVLVRAYGRNLRDLAGASIYELSAHGALHRALSKCSSHIGFELTCSEYHDDVEPGKTFNGVRCENIEQLSFADETFDLVTSTEVMEHVENDLVAYGEIFRILKPGGNYVFTVPIDVLSEKTIVRAVREQDGSILNLLEEEHHGDPQRGLKGVFTWRNYGLEVVKALECSGFRAELVVPELVEMPAGLMATRPVIYAYKPECHMPV